MFRIKRRLHHHKSIEIYVPIIIAAISLVVSIVALYHSDKTFILLNRPYLTTAPIKNEADLYYNLSLEEFSISGYYEIYNAGNTPAINIKIPGMIVKGDFIETVTKNVVNQLPISLGPKQKAKLGFYVRFKLKSDSNTKGGTLNFVVQVPIHYGSLLPAEEYKTIDTYEYRSTKESPQIIESVYK